MEGCSDISNDFEGEKTIILLLKITEFLNLILAINRLRCRPEHAMEQPLSTNLRTINRPSGIEFRNE